MIKASDLTQKEVINVKDGKILGLIADLDVDLERGKINAIVIPSTEKVFKMFGKQEEYEILWGEIKKIGIDVILVEVKGNIESRSSNYLENELKQYKSEYLKEEMEQKEEKSIRHIDI